MDNNTPPTTKLTYRFESALVYATQLHSHQARKGSGVPYISHLLSVCALVIEDGGDEDEAIAALLHDAIEDQGGGELLRGQARAASYSADCLVVDFLRPPLLGLTSGQ